MVLLWKPKQKKLMKLNRRQSIFFLLIPAFVFSSCLGTNDEVQVSSNDAHFISLKFSKNDSVPNLEKAVFSIYYDELSGDSVIVNLDSLPFQTRIDSVIPRFVFASTSTAYLVYKDIDGNDSLYTLNITGTDTIDFTVPMRVRNISLDKKNTLEYGIKVNVHQVEPELYVWKQLSDGLLNNNYASNQHALSFNNTIYCYLNTGVNNYLYTAPMSDYANWTNRSDMLTGLPTSSITLRHMQVFNNTLYLFSDNNKIYSSSNGETWSGVQFPNAGYTTVELLFVFLNKMWGIVQETGTQKYYMAYTANGVDWTVDDNEIADDFPIEQYTTLSFKTRLGLSKAIVVGGERRAATSPYPFVWSTEDGTRWVSFARQNQENQSITGASIILYDGKLLMFHGTDNHITQSVNEGYSWTAMDTTYTKLPENYYLRNFQSVFVNENDKRIFIIGGKDASRVFTDVWTGKLNRLNWE